MSTGIASAKYKANNIGDLSGSLQPLAATDKGRLNNGAPSKSTSLVSYTNGNGADHNPFMSTIVDSGKGTTFTRGEKDFNITDTFSYNTIEKDGNDYTNSDARQTAITKIYTVGTKNVVSERNKTESDKDNGDEGADGSEGTGDGQ